MSNESGIQTASCLLLYVEPENNREINSFLSNDLKSWTLCWPYAMEAKKERQITNITLFITGFILPITGVYLMKYTIAKIIFWNRAKLFLIIQMRIKKTEIFDVTFKQLLMLRKWESKKIELICITVSETINDQTFPLTKRFIFGPCLSLGTKWY